MGNTLNAKQDKFQDGLQSQMEPIAVSGKGNTLNAERDKFQDGLQNQMEPVAVSRSGNTLNVKEDKFQDGLQNKMRPVPVSPNIGDDGGSQNISHVKIHSKHVNECNFTYNESTNSEANSQEMGKSGRRYKLTLDILRPRQVGRYFGRRHSQMHTLKWNHLNFDKKIHWSLFQRVQSTIWQHCFR